MRGQEVARLLLVVRRGAAHVGGVAAFVAVLGCGGPTVDAIDVAIPAVGSAAPEAPRVEERHERTARSEPEPPPLDLERWSDDVGRRARADGRPALVVVCAAWIVACAHLERDVLSSAEVRAAAEPFVGARLDLSGASAVDDDAQRDLGAQHVPSVVLLAPGGRRVERWRAEDLEAPALAAALREFARD